ncbi:MAG: HNH endonuclease [Verrucomicrobiae bacterium]|nr:HNH endonuclease [Verrucomicrobiae bacterium]
MKAEIREAVRVRVGDECEYCRLTQEQSPFARLQIEHIRPRQHGGDDQLENLALACIDCNLSKGPNLTGIDPETGRITELFHPRRSRWSEHFEWNGPLISGVTDIGRTTVALLGMNREDRVEVRLAWT